MERRQIKCVKKNSSGKITDVGGDFGTISEASAIYHMSPPKIYQYFVKVGSTEVDVIIAHREGTEYLRTDPDYTTSDNLDSLRSC
jgi:Protein of unknown function (DUF3892)